MHNIIKNELAGYFEVEHKPSEEELKAYYQKEYYQDSKGSYAQAYPEAELQFKRNKIKIKSSIAEKYLPDNHNKKILDVGCGEGFVLDVFKEKNWNIKGLDFSKFGCENHNPHVADKVTQGNIYSNLMELISKGEKYDLIWLDNVLEHVRDVNQLLNICHQLSYPHTVLSITVPNDFSQMQLALLEDKMIPKEFWVRTPDHLSYFTASSLKETMKLAHWKTHSIIADFPIDWFLTNSAANYIENKSAGKPAHHSRVWLYNHICNNNEVEAVIQFFESLANIGMGRNITGFFTANKAAN